MAKRKGVGKKGGKKLISINVDSKRLKKEVSRREKRLSSELDRLTEDVDEMLSANPEIQELKKEIRQKPLLYTALAFTTGVAVGAILKRD